MRQVVRYRNRKLYEPAERRFVTIQDLARSVAAGEPVEVRSAETGEDLTAKILSRALASERSPIPASTDALTKLLRASSEAAESVAGMVEKVAGQKVADSVRRASSPERLAETLAPLTRRVENARTDVERIVAGLVGRGRLTWEEGARLKEDFGTVFHESLRDVLDRVRELMVRISPQTTPEIAREMADLKTRIDQLEALAARSFATPSVPASKPHQNGRPASGTKRRKTA
ncbi:MAG: hypothetical protein IT186_26945 [Acidobacteria bacterium]|nr:hypothetical protein [Acidobacteriota bacterium]MCG3190855.1 hypothetical protein [Thermoanaerobaculia bacterium]MCK6684505.1 polyhydroxyalkanoate synthesis regulator DNA-binding domain-containing protein [Thermoanaerobaculia bacterium]